MYRSGRTRPNAHDPRAVPKREGGEGLVGDLRGVSPHVDLMIYRPVRDRVIAVEAGAVRICGVVVRMFKTHGWLHRVYAACRVS